MSKPRPFLVITGASGFIGKQLVPLLADRGFRLLLVGRDESRLKAQFPGFECCTYDDLPASAKDADALVHLATKNNDAPGSLESFREANVDLLSDVLEACRKAKISSLIYTSTLHAGSKASHYGVTKAEADELLEQNTDLQILRLRLPAVYGNNQFQGRLGMLNRVPTFLTPLALQMLKSLKPTTHVEQLIEPIKDFLSGGSAGALTVSDRQHGNWVYSAAKKLIDVGFALFVLLALWWVLLLSWIAVKVTSRGPGVFAQTRVGKSGKPFTCYKFRTMTVGTKQAGTHEVSSASITSAGKFLRRSKIDELPQVINILRGEVSLVGPRPCLPVQEELIEERTKRGVLQVLPGITGFSQVAGIDMSDPVRLAEKDADYCDLRTIPLDLKIILQTAFRK